MSKENLEAGFFHHLFKFLDDNNYKVDVAQDYSVDRAKVIKIATKDYVVDKANNYNVDRTTISTGQCKIYFEMTTVLTMLMFTSTTSTTIVIMTFDSITISTKQV